MIQHTQVYDTKSTERISKTKEPFRTSGESPPVKPLLMKITDLDRE